MKLRQAAKRFFPSTNLSTGIDIFDQELKGHQGFPRGSLTVLTGVDAFLLGHCFKNKISNKNFRTVFLQVNKNSEIVFARTDNVFDYNQISDKAVLAVIHKLPVRLMCHADVIIESSYIDKRYTLQMTKNRFSPNKPCALVKVKGEKIEVIDSIKDISL